MLYLKNVTSLRLDVGKCVGCRRCLDVCPHRVLAVTNGKCELVTRDACMECGACALNCPTGALTVDSGVGCAAGLLNLALGREGACCGEKKTCGCQTSECETKNDRRQYTQGETNDERDG